MKRLSCQKPSLILSKLDNLPPDATPEEKAMLEWMLKRRDYPVWRYEVFKSVEATINIPKDNVKPKDDSIDITEILSVTHEDNIEELKSVKTPANYNPIPTLDQISKSFQNNLYFMPEQEIFTVHQAISLNRPLMVSGPPGVGKTELAKQIALAMNLNINNHLHFDKLFCTPETDINEAIYDWNHAKRLSDLQLLNAAITSLGSRINSSDIHKLYKQIASESYGSRYLMVRKLLKACLVPYRMVMLIDEADKPSPNFDNNLLDILAHFRFEIPEFGTIGRKNNDQSHEDNPFFVLTVNDSANGGRDLSDMLVSRCTPLFLNYLPANLESQIISKKCGVDIDSAGKIADFFYSIRVVQNLRRPPSTREVIATTEALVKQNYAPTEDRILKLHCHWLKNRLDLEKIRSYYKGIL